MSDDDGTWRTNYDAHGQRNVYDDDGEKIGEEYDRNRDTRFQKSSPGTARRAPSRGSSGPNPIIDLAFWLIALALRYAPFVVLGYYLARTIIPEYYPASIAPVAFNQYIAWGGGAVGAIVAALIVRALFRIVFSHDGVLVLPFKALMVVAVCGLQFVAIAWTTLGMLSPDQQIPTTIEQVTVRSAIGALLGLVLGYLVARWVFNKWLESAF